MVPATAGKTVGMTSRRSGDFVLGEGKNSNRKKDKTMHAKHANDVA